MPDLHYEEPSLAELYDLDSGWSLDRDFYLALAGKAPQRVLDLGCGTGLLCDAYAALGHVVTGVDPARAMLDIARQKPNGDRIDWVQAAAQHFRSPERFDLIIMTGHAFQVFLDDSDVLAVLATIRQHLAPGGMIAFESRNPAIDWPARWNRDADLAAEGHSIRQSRRVSRMANRRIAFDTHYELPGRTLVSSSELLFLSRTEIEDHLTASGLRAEAVYGGWLSEPFDEAVSEEIIVIVRAA
ncbi:class I SAM-dependent methyltransferase [Rhizobium sp. LjRoot98]|uniref:class I SAM-dependent methyltransferase n=1 Tax=unclassified Rhizobium TaxID=2613769 RepID=UPI000714197F|nr:MULTISPECIES: class I SAM-dependent methyltransferase [unclassified Rhizobium]KQV42097.1 methyltransferase [Rhizobium sp. Root1204]KQY17983.1 methyltransferase [Rhizobium sp. Root1334]KRC13840.1 methyltransferase [Rhizobium sp. Root73]